MLTFLFGWRDWIDECIAKWKEENEDVESCSDDEEIDEPARVTRKKNFITDEAFRDCIISCNCWLLQLLVLLKLPANLLYAAFKSGSNACEAFFSALCGFGGIEAGKRDATYLEMIRLASNVLTLLKWSGDQEEGGFDNLKIPSKNV